MKVVALLGVRNEALYLPICLEHLYRQGVETCVIDNGSTDKSKDIARSFIGRGVFRIDDIPYNGQYEWEVILKYKEKLALELDADWFIHHDADEIREAPIPYKDLLQGIENADNKGFNAINFDEFVFLPAAPDEHFEGKDFLKEMRYYYYFNKRPLHRVNAWKKTMLKIDLATSGGHRVVFDGQKICPEHFILRHYIALSKEHLIKKYSTRAYSRREVNELGWHTERAGFDANKLIMPNKEELKQLSADGNWDRSDPWKDHKMFNYNGYKDVQ